MFAAALAALSGCSDLMGSQADVTVRLEVSDQPAVMRTRQEVLASAPSWGGVRVGEQSADVGDSALEFTLPGQNLEIALGALDALDATVVSTDIDVETSQVIRTTAPPDSGDASAGDREQVRMRVEVSPRASEGVETAVRFVFAVFSVIGMVATVRWLRSLIGRRRSRRSGPPARAIDRVDLRDDPPTEETPRVPPGW